MDYGHDPVLRQEKIIIRVQASSHNSHEVHNTQTQFPSQPDVTIFSDGGKAAKYPDLVSSKLLKNMNQNDILKSPLICNFWLCVVH